MGIPDDILHLFPPNTPARFVFLTSADQTVKQLLYAAFGLMIWDHMLTLQREIQLVWRAHWTVIKALFLFNRYITALVIAANAWICSGLVVGLNNEACFAHYFHIYIINSLLFPQFCQTYILVTTALELLCISFVSFVVLFRLHAVWGGSRNALIALLSLWSLSFIASVVVYLTVVYPAKHMLFHEDRFDVCFGLIPNFWIQWAPDALLHILMLNILVWNAIATPRSARTRILGLLYREGILYYSVTLIVLVGGILTWRFGDDVWIGVPLYPGWVVCQIAMSRLLLNLKSATAFEPMLESTGTTSALRMPRSISRPASVEADGDYALESFKSSSKQTQPPYMLENADIEAMEVYRCASGQSLRPIRSPASGRSDTPEMLSKEEREHRMRARTRVGAYGKRWWWWILGVDSSRSEAKISVDASTVERWDPGDPGPGVKDSRLGRYDHWL